MKILFSLAACVALSCIAAIGAIMGALFVPFALRPHPDTPRSIFETRRAGLA
jgi:hypothetical protein